MLFVVAAVVLSLVAFTGGDDDESAVATQGSKTKTSAPRSSTSKPKPTQSKPTAPPPAPANVDPGSLPGLLSTAAEVSSVMSTPGMITDPIGTNLIANTSTAPPGCTAIWAPTDESTYATSKYTAVARQTVRQEPKTTTAVVQSIVAFPDESAAKAAADQVVAAWERCPRTEFRAPIGGSELTFKSGVVGKTDGTATLLIFSRGQLDSPGTSSEPNCQRAVTPRKNVVVDVLACSPNVASAGFTIARDIGAKITGTR